MGTPEEKNRKRMRIRSHIAKDLGTVKYRQKIKDENKNGKNKKRVVPKDLSHSDLVRLINNQESL